MAVSQLHRINNSKGQTIVEFALVVSLLLAILFGIVELGRLWWYSNHLNNSVRAAARYGAVLGNTTGLGVTRNVKTYLRTELSGFIPADTATLPDSNISVSLLVPGKVFPNVTTYNPIPNGYTLRRGSTLTVTANYRYTIFSGRIIPFINTISGPRTLRRSASMLYE